MNFNREDLRSFLAEVETGYKLQRISLAVSVADEIPALCSEITQPTVFENLQGFANWRLTGMEDSMLRSGTRYGIDATKPPLSQPDKRIYFERLKARGEGTVFLQDYLNP